MDGIKNNLVPPAPIEENLFETSHSDIQILPDTLDLAKKIADESDFIKKAF